MLGSALCDSYHNEHDIYALHRDKKCLATCSYDSSLDLLDTESLSKIIDKFDPELLIHCASLTDIELCESDYVLANLTNAKIAENIAKLCGDKIKFIYVSTDQVYGEKSDKVESLKSLKPINNYGITKLFGEQLIQKHCRNYLILRTNIFGWNVNHKKVSSAEWIFYSLKRGKELNLFFDYIFSPIYTRAFGEILLQLVHKDKKGIINIGSRNSCSKFDFGLQLAIKFCFDQKLINRSSILDFNFNSKRASNIELNCSLLNSLDVSIPSWEESLNQFYNDKIKADNEVGIK